MSTFGCLGILVFWGIGPVLHAAESVTLTNGFNMVCDHREPDGDRVRLYTSQGSSNFVEVDAAEIASVEEVPDPPPSPKLTAEPKLTHADVHQLIARAGAEHNLDVDLLASVVRAESGGNIHAVSRAGAQGLMQLMPGTAAQLGVTDSFRADQNINGGTAYLDALLVKYHDQLALALAAYNAGPAAVDKYHGIPPYRETRVYVARVITEFNRRKQWEKLHPSLQSGGTAALSSTHASQKHD
ncbi:MAG TPA: lytic transglycosylase domain-containing protein [Acidobacteriaceae bacterium]|nr:lytic transglycosylase domain-containing protein [Acidobacteriaceae bacterium]